MSLSEKNTTDKEFLLLLNILQDTDAAELKTLLSHSPAHDFDLLLKQIKWHRMDVTVFNKCKHLTDLIPEAFFKQLAMSSNYHIQKSLQAISTLKLIDEAFNNQHINYLIFKGLVLSQQFYGSSVERSSKDIDIFIDQEDIQRIHYTLLDLNFIQISPNIVPGSNQFLRYMTHQKDAVYYHREHKVELEIHWRLDKNPLTLPVEFNSIYKRSTLIAINTMNLKTFNTIDNFTYLIVHGSISMWGRLRWLYDLHVSLLQNNDLDWDQFLTQVAQLKIQQMLGLYIILEQNLFKITAPEQLQTLKIHYKTKKVAELILSHLPKMQYPPQYQRIIARSCLKPGLAYKTTYMKNISLSLLNDAGSGKMK